jgi:hypothetical protein
MVRKKMWKSESNDEMDELCKIFFIFLMMENTATEAGKGGT